MRKWIIHTFRYVFVFCDLSSAHILLLKLFLYISESELTASVILELRRGNEMFERKMYNYRFVAALVALINNVKRALAWVDNGDLKRKGSQRRCI